jgi:hypothetical protein
MTFATLLHPLGFGLPAGIVALVVLRYAAGSGDRHPRPVPVPNPAASSLRRRVPAAEMERRVREQRPLPPVGPFI